jgi:hypothetical protein
MPVKHTPYSLKILFKLALPRQTLMHAQLYDSVMVRLVFGMCSVQIPDGPQAILFEVLCGFPGSLRANSRIVPWLGHNYFFHSFSNSSAVLPLDAIQDVPEEKLIVLGGHSTSRSKQKLSMYMCPILNGFRDIAISLYSTVLYCTLYRRATRHVLTRVAKCIHVDGGIFENVLY